MVIDLFPISWFPINLFTQMHGYSMRTAVTKSRQQRRRNKREQNNGEEDRTSRRAEETYSVMKKSLQTISVRFLEAV